MTNSFFYRLVFIISFLFTSNVYSQINEEFGLKWLTNESEINVVGKYNKLELGIVLDKKNEKLIKEFIKDNINGLNPYDPSDINVEVKFLSPTAKEKIIYGFYYISYYRKNDSWEQKPTPYHWRVRFTPNELGEWKYSVNVSVKGKSLGTLTSEFKCVTSSEKGILKIDKDKRYLYLSETKEPFFTIGHNIAQSAYYKLSPKKAQQHKDWLTELAKNGGNFFRLEMGPQNGLPDWDNYKNYTTKMPQLWEFDQLMEHAKELDLYFILFRHHTEITNGESWDVSGWDKNPYRLGLNLEKREEYFTNQEALKFQKNTLRYIFSRWGYNTSFAFFEYQEVDNWLKDLIKETDYSEKKAITLFKDWYLTQKEYIKTDLGYENKLFINTYAVTPNLEYNASSNAMFANSDAIGFHKYGQSKSINYIDKYDKAVKLWNAWKKPLLVEEMGVNASSGSNYLPLYKCDKSEFHNGIWSTSFMGTTGTGMVWWWDRGVHDFDHYKGYQALANFFEKEQLNMKNYIPQKWHSKLSVKRALIENYALKTEDRTKAIGWVHNATNYWRNISSPCLEDLLENGSFSTPHQLKDGYTIGKPQKEKTNFSKNTDAYTDKGGVQDVSSKVFEIKGLKKSSIFSGKQFYELVFYSTIDNKEDSKQTLKTNMWGRLKPKFPSGAEDFSYKVKLVD